MGQKRIISRENSKYKIHNSDRILQRLFVCKFHNKQGLPVKPYALPSAQASRATILDFFVSHLGLARIKTIK
jgi:hypothetical protein